jgi:ATP diphosphatase
MAKVREELVEVEAAAGGGDPRALEEEIGDLLFAVVNYARLAGVHVGPAMEAANAKFRKRFRELERVARERGVPLPGAPLEELDRLWDEIKRKER